VRDARACAHRPVAVICRAQNVRCVPSAYEWQEYGGELQRLKMRHRPPDAVHESLPAASSVFARDDVVARIDMPFASR